MSNASVYLLADLGFGDQGKGTMVDALARKNGAHTVVRYSGGPQAGHGVVTPNGRYHIFAQFGSATFVPGVETFLSRFMLIDPWRMLVEAEHLAALGVKDALERTMISENALVISPFHGAANRLREIARGDGRHGSCGLGVGETMKDSLEQSSELVLRAGMLRALDHPTSLRGLHEAFQNIQHFKREQLWQEGILDACWKFPHAKEDINLLLDDEVSQAYLIDLLDLLARVRIVADAKLGEILERPGAVIFEPSQGVLLDEWRGFDPYTTWTTCTLQNADTLLEEQRFCGPVRRMGIVRAYGTRHGPGPFPSYDDRLMALLPDPPSVRDQWQGHFRVGWHDAVLTRYAIACCGKMDSLIVTCLDRLKFDPAWQVCVGYEEGSTRTRDIPLGLHKDLAYQRELTQRLFAARPIFAVSTNAPAFEQRVQEHVAFLSHETNLPVSILSLGPTANDKRYL